MLGQRKLGQDRCSLAIKLSHGVAIAWDGMELRHCTSLAERSGEMKWMRGRYGVFTAAKRQTVSFSPRAWVGLLGMSLIRMIWKGRVTDSTTFGREGEKVKKVATSYLGGGVHC